MATWAMVLFFVVFLSQIFLISFYFPNKIVGRMNYILETYPPEEYPKLYPSPVEYSKIGRWAFRMISRVVFLMGFVVFAAIFFLDPMDDGAISEAWPAIYGMLQFVPFALLEFSELKQFKLMRQVNSTTKRKAELRPRRLFDYISPTIVFTAVLLFLGSAAIDLYLHDFAMEWKTFARIFWMVVANLFMAGCGAWALYGAKLDPHQSFDDRAKQITVQLKSLFYVSMVISIFFMIQAVDDVYDIDFLDATVLSLYFQVIVLMSTGHILNGLKLEDINFDVYKSDTPTTS